MSGNFVITHIESGVMTITIDRQEKLNALNSEVLNQLKKAFDKAAAASEVRCIVLTGSGDKAFVAGADISELRDLEIPGVRQLVVDTHSLFLSIERMGKPVIAAVNGYALGGGCELALACHIRIASDNALMGLPEVQLGLMPGYGGSQRLSRLVGQGRAIEIMLSGKPVKADQAREIGMVNRVVEQGALMETSMKLASQFAAAAPLAMKSILQAVQDGADMKLEDGLELETRLFTELFETEDMREGTAAFLEKRKPAFKGS